MKSMKSIIKIFMIASAFWLVSCENLSDFNIDPNNSSTARPQEVLTSALGYTAFVMDAQYNDQAFLWGQYWTWGTGVSLGQDARYVQEPRNANQAWARSYSDALADIGFLKKTDNAAFNGIGKTLEVFIYQYLVDHFGDVPYSQAIQGAIEDGSVLAPQYDDDAAIYPQLVTALDDAISDLNAALGDQILATSVGAEDLIYGGDLNQWVKFANSLKLRVLMRMSDVNNVSAQVQELIANGTFIETSADIAEVPFTGVTGSENPMFAWEESGIGLFYKAATTVTDVQDELNDPRKFYVYKEAVNFPGEIRAGAQNEIALCFTCVDEDWSDPADVAYGAGVPTIFMSDWETWFLRAEAAVKFGTADDATAAFVNGIAANFAYIGAPDGAAYGASLNFGAQSSDIQINMIGVQKWLAMNGLQEAEGWIEARRFDTPENPIFTGASGIYQDPLQSALQPRQFPVRWVYPESEVTLNVNAPAQSTILTKVFWDR
jgi:hypothetical protein